MSKNHFRWEIKLNSLNFGPKAGCFYDFMPKVSPQGTSFRTLGEANLDALGAEVAEGLLARRPHWAG